MPAVGGPAADGLSHPEEQLVIGGGAQKPHHSQLHDEVVHKILDLLPQYTPSFRSLWA